MRFRLYAACAALVCAACASAETPPITTKPSTACDFRVLDLNKRLCAEQKGVLVVIPNTSHPCGTCIF